MPKRHLELTRNPRSCSLWPTLPLGVSMLALSFALSFPQPLAAQQNPIVDLSDPNVSVDLSVLNDGGLAPQMGVRSSAGTSAAAAHPDGAAYQAPGKKTPVSTLYIQPSSSFRLPPQTKAIESLMSTSVAQPAPSAAPVVPPPPPVAVATAPEPAPVQEAAAPEAPAQVAETPAPPPTPTAAPTPEPKPESVAEAAPMPTPEPAQEVAAVTPPPPPASVPEAEPAAEPEAKPMALEAAPEATPEPAPELAQEVAALTPPPPQAAPVEEAAPAAPPPPTATPATPPPAVAAMEHDETQTAPRPSKPNETVMELPPQDQVASLPPATGPLSDGDSMRIVFDADSSKLPQTARDTLLDMAGKMRSQETLRLQLLAYAGTADTSASAARRLSLSRALAVRSFLIENGVRSTRIDVRALGNKSTEEVTERVDITVVER